MREWYLSNSASAAHECMYVCVCVCACVLLLRTGDQYGRLLFCGAMGEYFDVYPLRENSAVTHMVRLGQVTHTHNE